MTITFSVGFKITIAFIVQIFTTNGLQGFTYSVTSYPNTNTQNFYGSNNDLEEQDISQNFYDVDDNEEGLRFNDNEEGLRVNQTADSLDDLFKDTCFRQTCRQTISGRNLDYNRALHILQSEEYISALTGERAPLIVVDRYF